MAVLALLVGSSAQAQTITGTEWDNPDITSVNREAAHTLAIPMATEQGVRSNDFRESPYYQSLDGTWKFMWVKNPSLAQNMLCKKDLNDSSWGTIDVPASWQVYGIHNNKNWDKPLYCNVAYPSRSTRTPSA